MPFIQKVRVFLPCINGPNDDDDYDYDVDDYGKNERVGEGRGGQ